MGIYDSLTIDYSLPFDFKGVDPTKLDFQTKDLDRGLINYKIDTSGELFREHCEWEDIPLNEREYPDPKHKLHWIGSQRKKNAWWGEVKHHGVINFYTTIQRGKHNLEWVEFNATFTHGKLEKIELVDNHFTDTTENDTAIEKMFAESDRRRSIWYLKYYDKFTNNCWRIKNRFKNWLIKWINKI